MFYNRPRLSVNSKATTMKKLTESELKEIEKMNNEKKDIVTFVLFETGILFMIAGFIIQASEWPGTVFLIIGFASLLIAAIRRYLLIFNKVQPVVKSFPKSLIAVQSLFLLLYFIFKSNDTVVYVIAGLLIVVHIITVLAIIYAKKKTGGSQETTK